MSISPFLNLPRELRDQIYTHALHHPTGLHLSFNTTRGPHQPALTNPAPATHPLALTQTSALLRAETSTLPYALNEIHLHTTFSHQIRQIGEPPSAEKSPFTIHQSLTAWLDAIGARNAGAIRRRHTFSSSKRIAELLPPRKQKYT
ncbi:hypothetical protein BDY17DRAFT_343246 [Neohortaea acidophila]|uniref:2EXR domain-containing protein n=1 Tax=Neohortaea acidophila TaxID=245834 RepID=A0A6A6Q1R0_9PEZI|nr:uncharacterized protein BDY17DRAFT_343246 [Neohortaea acidophila]KAF2486330.1 hypothetical protein BDY17DRAFT_343246 [Neohortaea acidophila]